MLDINKKKKDRPFLPSAEFIVKKIIDSPFFTFSKLPLDFINKEKLFKITFAVICIAMAVLTLIHPFVILFRIISSGYFNFGLKYILAFILTWLAIFAACWLGFHLWWNRRKKIEELGTSEFIAIPFFSELIRTFGEWLGLLYIIIGAVGGLFALIILRDYSGGMLTAVLFGVNFGANSEGILSELPFFEIINGIRLGLFSLVLKYAVIIGPAAGLLTIFISRFISERLRVLAAIANNTKGCNETQG